MIFISIALDIMLKNNASERKPGGEGWGGEVTGPDKKHIQSNFSLWKPL